MIAKKTRKSVMPPKRIWALGTQILFPYNLRAYRTWEIAGTQDTAPDTKTTLNYPASVFLQYTNRYMLSI
ncbi:hypothetical protein CER18_02310 [Bartonella tribocorum]|uniref:Uncharacterized protein n=1 Tax=Bartonella tribocorum TaxID=85701 RepID=A0A2M6UUJ5_9HYPH|nr:hypothetical protein CER18_02310 [Bartonella tribocorum]